jgi:phosphoribulokinase
VKIDLFFIDGAHSYPCVKSDTENALKCMKRGGLLIWHDYGRVGVNGVSKYLHELAEEMPIFSVPGSSLAFSVIP